MKTKDFPLSVKEVTEEGTFEGYGSVFGNVDSYGEKVAPGAFVESLARHKRDGSAVLMLWQHNPDNPIGIWEDLAEDAKGLWGRGRILLEVQSGREAYARLKAGAVRGLSIGYREQEADQEQGVRILKKLDLLEISIVSFPANRRARVEAVKSEALQSVIRKLKAGVQLSERELETAFKAPPFGLSNSQAERAVRSLLKRRPGDPDRTAKPAVDEAFANLRAAVDSLLCK